MEYRLGRIEYFTMYTNLMSHSMGMYVTSQVVCPDSLNQWQNLFVRIVTRSVSEVHPRLRFGLRCFANW
jgi:hypothetical protein